MGCCLCNCLVRLIGGEWKNEKQMWAKETGLSEEALKLIDEAFDGLDPQKILDVHVHLLGINPSESGCYLHENMDNCCRCQSFVKKRVMMQSAGASPENEQMKDIEYVDRLVSLFETFIPTYLQNQIRSKSNKLNKKDSKDSTDATTSLLKKHNSNEFDSYQNESLIIGTITPRAVLLGLDEVYNKETGLSEPHNTSVHTPHEYVSKIVNDYSYLFTYGISIHPYRNDCIKLLELYHKKGCKIIKWLPNSMGIDPNDPKFDPFYKKLKELDMMLLSHTGAEHSLDDAVYV